MIGVNYLTPGGPAVLDVVPFLKNIAAGRFDTYLVLADFLEEGGPWDNPLPFGPEVLRNLWHAFTWRERREMLIKLQSWAIAEVACQEVLAAARSRRRALDDFRAKLGAFQPLLGEDAGGGLRLSWWFKPQHGKPGPWTLPDEVYDRLPDECGMGPLGRAYESEEAAVAALQSAAGVAGVLA